MLQYKFKIGEEVLWRGFSGSVLEHIPHDPRFGDKIKYRVKLENGTVVLVDQEELSTV